jgi:hypothetical protein
MAMTDNEMIEAALAGELDVTADGEVAAQKDEQASDDDDDEAQADDEESPEEVVAPIASKSGEYTIPYDQLVKARERAKAAEALAEESRKKQEELQEKLDALITPKAATPVESDTQLDVSLFGDFSEEDIAKGIAELQRRERDALRAEMKAAIDAEMAPIRQQRQESAEAAHYAAIYAAHPDADDLLESDQFAKWKDTLPAFAQAGVVNALENGSAEQVIEVFSSFKSDASQTTGTPEPEAKRRVPHSLSEIAGEPHQDMVQQALGKAHSPSALLDAMAGLSTEQIDRVLNASM